MFILKGILDTVNRLHHLYSLQDIETLSVILDDSRFPHPVVFAGACLAVQTVSSFFLIWGGTVQYKWAFFKLAVNEFGTRTSRRPKGFRWLPMGKSLYRFVVPFKVDESGGKWSKINDGIQYVTVLYLAITLPLH